MKPSAATTPPPSSHPTHLAEVLHATRDRRGDRRLLMRRAVGGWEDVTAAGFAAEVAAVAKGFVAAGIGPGDRVAIMSKTRYEWTLCDFALWAVAAVPVPIYETSSVDQIEWILSDSGAVGCVVETASHAHRLAAARDRVPSVKHVWQLESGTDAGASGAITDLVMSGAQVPDAELAARQQTLGPASIATLIYTSGTTGRPKGCVLTHGNFVAECASALRTLPQLFEQDDASTLLFLPLAHVFGRMIQVAVLMQGITLAHSDPARLVRDLAAVRPTFVLSVPQVFEKIYETARRKAAASGRGSVFERAAAVAVTWSRAQDTGGAGLVLSLQHKVFDALVYGKLRAAFGGRARYAVSGGAPLGDRLGHFFRGIGVEVLEGYGLTETTAAAAANRVGSNRIGTVGPALDGFEVRIAENGEVLLRGGHVFSGYWNDQDATAEAVDDDGWFHTGDLGTLDENGYLTITGRSKEIIVTAGGKNVAPAGLEAMIRAHPVVAQAMVVGDRRATLAALVTLDQESLDQWLTDADRTPRPAAELVDDQQVRAAVQGAVDEANSTVSGAEQIRRFAILPVDWTEDSGHLTPTLKLKRDVVLADFAGEIETLYAGRAGAGD
ncbi:MAG: AMP-dependent synthetase/ligase [Angustibacter sp.]